MYHLALNIVNLCREGLEERGLGEEVFVKPLYDRIINQTNPAKEMLRRMESGESMESIVRSYSLTR